MAGQGFLSPCRLLDVTLFSIPTLRHPSESWDLRRGSAPPPVIPAFARMTENWTRNFQALTAALKYPHPAW